MDSGASMEAWAKQFHFCFAPTSSHCFYGIETRRLQYLPFNLLNPCIFILDVNNEGKVTTNLSDYTKHHSRFLISFFVVLL